MIYIDGAAFSSPPSQEHKTLFDLLEHPSVIAAVDLFKATPEEKFSIPKQSNVSLPKHVYVFQREYATVDPAFVEIVGTDEATTCVGIIIRNRKNGFTSISHMDFPGVVDFGLMQMLSTIIDNDMEAQLDVHLVGGFQDPSCEQANSALVTENKKLSGGHSFPLCSKIVEALLGRPENFHLQTVCVLKHNTSVSGGVAHPIVTGFLFETSTGSIRPASFDASSRCPDEIVRRIRIAESSVDNGKLLETYDTYYDRFQIAPCTWASNWRSYALSMKQCSDSEILLTSSTSPLAEGSDFVENQRRVFDYLINNPDWRRTFPKCKPRFFERTPDGGWSRLD